MRPASASRCRRRRAADDGAEARQPGAGRVGRAAGRRSRMLEAMLAARACCRSSRRRARSAPRATSRRWRIMTAAMIGVGEVLHRRRPRAGRTTALAAAGLAPLVLGAEGGAGAAQRHAVLDRLRAGRLCSRPRRCSRRRWSPARCRPTRRAAPTRRSIRASTRCAAIAARSRPPPRCARLMAGQRDPRLASGRRRARAGSLLPALPAAGDGRRASTCCARPRRRWRPRPTASPTIR